MNLKHVSSKKKLYKENKLIKTVLLATGTGISYLAWCLLVYVPISVKDTVPNFIIFGGILVGLGTLVSVLSE